MTEAPEPRARPTGRRRRLPVLAAAIMLGLLSATVRYGPGTPVGRGLIARLLTGVRVGDAGWLRVAGIEGDPWNQFTIARLEIADRRGVWLSARKVSVRWWAPDLWLRRLRIERLAASSINLVRQPTLLPSEGPAGSPPVALEIDAFNAPILMTPQFAWRAGGYLTEGALDLERRGLARGRLQAVSLTRGGDFLRLAFAFDRQRVSLDAHAREATGGALAGSLGLNATQPFTLDAHAEGSPRAGNFDLKSSVGAATPASASGAWSPLEAAAEGRIDLSSSRFLAPLRAGLGPEANFRFSAARSGEGLYRSNLQASGAKAAFSAVGEVDADRRRTGPAGLAIAVRLADVSALAGLAGLGPARLNGVLIGNVDRWRLAGQAAVEEVRLADASLARLGGPFQLASDPASFTLRAQLVGAGGKGEGPVAILLGPAPRAEGEVDWLPRGRVLVRRLQLRGATLEAQGEGASGLFGGLFFKGRARIHDLKTADPGASGQVLADWQAAQTKDDAPWTFSLRARGEGLRLASADLNAMLGAAPALKADGRVGAAGVTIAHASLQGAGVSLAGSGAVDSRGAVLAAIIWSGAGPLSLGPATLTGPMAGTAAVSGDLAQPHVELGGDVHAIDLPDLGGLTLRQAHLALSLTGEAKGVSGRFSLAAAGPHGPGRAAAGFQAEGQSLALSDIDADVAGVSLQGEGTFDNDMLSLADLSVAVRPGLVLSRGRMDGRLVIRAGADGPHANLTLKGAGLTLADGSADFDSVNLAADGPLRRLPYQIDAKGDALGLRGRLAGAGEAVITSGELAASFSGGGRIGAADVRTLAPAVVILRGETAAASARLSVGKSGRAEVTLTSGGAGLNVRAQLASLDVSLLDPDLVGRLDGAFDLAGQGAALRGHGQARLTDLAARDLDGSTPLSGTLEAAFDGAAVTLGARLSDPYGSTFAADLRLPATMRAAPMALAIDTRGPISGRFMADGAVGPLWDLTQGGAQSLAGRVSASGAIGGTLADPRLTGSASLEGGAFEDSGIGLRLKSLTVRAALAGDAIDVGTFSGTDGERGTVSGSGRISLQREGASGFKAALQGFRLLDNTLGQATASGTVNVERAADGKVRLGGTLNIDRAQISPAASAPSGVVAMDVVEINRVVEETPFLPQPEQRDAPVVVDVALKAPGGVFIKGRGLNLELSLDARVSGTLDDPALTGLARVVRGDYDFAGKRFQVDDSSLVRLGSTPQTITLDLTATREDPTLTAVVKIKGTAAAPTLTLSSTPPLPKDEILSQVLFGSSAAQLSGLEAAQLASAMAGLAGGGGLDVIGGLRSFAHLDRLAIESGALTGFSVAGGKYVTDRLYVELSDTAKTGQGAQVEWRLRKHLAIVSRVTSQGDHALSIRWRHDY